MKQTPRQNKHQQQRHKRTYATINDFLAREDVNDFLAGLAKTAPYITDAIVLYIDKRDGKCYWIITDGTLVSTATWMLESVKLNILNSNEEYTQ